MFKSIAVALTFTVTMVQAAPLESRSPPQIRCAPESEWIRGDSLGYGDLAEGASRCKLGIETTVDSSNTTQWRLVPFTEESDSVKQITNVIGVPCNSTDNNYSYYPPGQNVFGKNTPLKVRLPDYDESYVHMCLGIGSSGFEGPPKTYYNGSFVSGTYNLSVQPCSNTDFQHDALTNAQFFQSDFKLNFVVSATGKQPADQQNPPSWYMSNHGGNITLQPYDTKPKDEDEETYGLSLLL